MQIIPNDFSIRQGIDILAPWFHNIHLPGGEQTAPDHFLGDFPNCKWKQIKRYIPRDLTGWKCLDIGCNGGFYALELAKRGADVLGIDFNARYLAQGNFAAQALALKNPPSFVQMQIHELARLDEEFDLVLFMGVFYHLRYPALALDTVSRMVRKVMIFQSLTMDLCDEKSPPADFTPEGDYPMERRDVFQLPGWPKVAFIEQRFSGDYSNWWIPNHAVIMAMLRSTGFETVRRVALETYLCKPPPQGVWQRRYWNTQEWFTATGTPLPTANSNHHPRKSKSKPRRSPRPKKR